jgi:hypothetical protein
MSLLAKQRQQADAANKAAAKNPMLKTGGDGRMTEEMVNTAALARAKGAQRVIPREMTTLPLAELIKRPR